MVVHFMTIINDKTVRVFSIFTYFEIVSGECKLFFRCRKIQQGPVNINEIQVL